MRLEWIPLLPLWRAIRQHSLTFAIVFASTLLGASVVRAMRHILRELSAPWLLLWILPIILIGAAAKKEKDWVPNADLRRRLALGIALGSIGLALLIALVRRQFLPEPEPEPTDASSQSEPSEPLPPKRDHRPGPRGK